MRKAPSTPTPTPHQKGSPIGPDGAYFSTEFQQFLLPYEADRAASDPDRAVAEFLRTTYEAAADRGHWDRAALEDAPSRWHGISATARP